MRLKEAIGNHFLLVLGKTPPGIERTSSQSQGWTLYHQATELCISVLTTTPNCSGSDRFAYSFSYLAKALSCSCSGRCFTRFYKEVRWKVVRIIMGKAKTRCKGFVNCLQTVRSENTKLIKVKMYIWFMSLHHCNTLNIHYCFWTFKN